MKKLDAFENYGKRPSRKINEQAVVPDTIWNWLAQVWPDDHQIQRKVFNLAGQLLGELPMGGQWVKVAGPINLIDQGGGMGMAFKSIVVFINAKRTPDQYIIEVRWDWYTNNGSNGIAHIWELGGDGYFHFIR